MKILKIDYNSDLFNTAVDIYNRVWPEYTESREELEHYDKNYDPKFYYQRFIVKHDNNYVAAGHVGEPWWSYKPGKLHFELSVLKEFRTQGVGSFCLDYIENILSERKGYKLNTHSKEDYKDGISFLENRGFKIVLREPGSKLNVNDFNLTNFQNVEEKLSSDGIVIKSLKELQKIDQNWKQSLYELYAQIIKDVPNNDELTERTFENFKKFKLEAPGYDPSAFFVALENGKYVGLSSLWIQTNKPKEYWTDLTGVLRDHRRKGIALALKVQTIRYVIESEGISIETDNEESNPMFGINKLLGFKPLPAWLTYEKRYD
ncbi:MAG: GNAT family N-acetyltransferase [Draconibacterium sp.]|nr:GNAT family N-acetyltransferase [Draconibacterium sp.]